MNFWLVVGGGWWLVVWLVELVVWLVAMKRENDVEDVRAWAQERVRAVKADRLYRQRKEKGLVRVNVGFAKSVPTRKKRLLLYLKKVAAEDTTQEVVVSKRIREDDVLHGRVNPTMPELLRLFSKKQLHVLEELATGQFQQRAFRVKEEVWPLSWLQCVALLRVLEVSVVQVVYLQVS